MNWEETINYIRSQNEFETIVKNSYLCADLVNNVERYGKSSEFTEIINIINSNRIGSNILDIGSGNGITAIAFALNGFNVTVVEPDSSDTVGCGAINYLKEHYKLSNLIIYKGFCEDINLTAESFDIVFSRQCMHHAYDLTKFVSEMSRVLKKGGLFLTVRDHVVFDQNDKELFFESHDLHKFYGGENAFSSLEYRNAIQDAGLLLMRELKYYDSVINYFPKSELEISKMHDDKIGKVEKYLQSKFGFLSFLFLNVYCWRHKICIEDTYDEKKIPGRMYSYVAIKQ